MLGAILLASSLLAGCNIDQDHITVFHLTGVPPNSLDLPENETRDRVPELVAAFEEAFGKGTSSILDEESISRVRAYLDELAQRDGKERYETGYDFHVEWEGEGFDVH